MFQFHTGVHLRLRPGGSWHNEQGGPMVGPAEEDSKDWAAIDEYMALFESIQILIEKGVIDLETVDRMCGYRLLNIVENPIIVRVKLGSEEKEWWSNFIKLENAIRQKHDWPRRPTEPNNTNTANHRAEISTAAIAQSAGNSGGDLR